MILVVCFSMFCVPRKSGESGYQTQSMIRVVITHVPGLVLPIHTHHIRSRPPPPLLTHSYHVHADYCSIPSCSAFPPPTYTYHICAGPPLSSHPYLSYTYWTLPLPSLPSMSVVCFKEFKHTSLYLLAQMSLYSSNFVFLIIINMIITIIC